MDSALDFIGLIGVVLVAGTGFILGAPKIIDWLTDKLMKIRWVKK